MNKLELLKLKKKLLTSALITTTTLEAIGLGSKEVNATHLKVENIPIAYALKDVELDKSEEELIAYYSNVYGLNYDKTYEIIYNLTKGFDNYAWDTFSLLDGKIYDRKENAIIAICNDIRHNPKNYGLESLNDIKEDVVETDMSFEELVEKHSDLQYINKVIPATIGHVECGSDMNSSLYRRQNNCGGFRTQSGYMSFPSREAGVIYLVNLLKDSYGCTIDSDKSFLNRIAAKYCEIPDHWISLAYPFYNNIENDFYHYAKQNPSIENEIGVTKRLVIVSDN